MTVPHNPGPFEFEKPYFHAPAQPPGYAAIPAPPTVRVDSGQLFLVIVLANLTTALIVTVLFVAFTSR